MEPIEANELKDLLKEWEAPLIPASLEKRLFPTPSRRFWRASVAVPFPIACCLALLLSFLAWRSLGPHEPQPARVLIRTERVEVPVVRERVVTRIIYKNRPSPEAKHELTFSELKPVGELRLKIVMHQDAQN